jgi:hypothetical protein
MGVSPMIAVRTADFHWPVAFSEPVTRFDIYAIFPGPLSRARRPCHLRELPVFCLDKEEFS